MQAAPGVMSRTQLCCLVMVLVQLVEGCVPPVCCCRTQSTRTSVLAAGALWLAISCHTEAHPHTNTCRTCVRSFLVGVLSPLVCLRLSAAHSLAHLVPQLLLSDAAALQLVCTGRHILSTKTDGLPPCLRDCSAGSCVAGAGCCSVKTEAACLPAVGHTLTCEAAQLLPQVLCLCDQLHLSSRYEVVSLHPHLT